MEKPRQPLAREHREPVDGVAMIKALDDLSNGPARRAMQTIDGHQGDLPHSNPKHDFEDK
jgi:hypothetical protein